MNNVRIDPKLRKQQILKSAVELAKANGYHNLTRDEIADHANVSMGLVTHYFETMVQLKRQVIRYAIKNELAEIIAQGLAIGDRQARKAPQSLKDKAASFIANY